MNTLKKIISQGHCTGWSCKECYFYSNKLIPSYCKIRNKFGFGELDSNIVNISEKELKKLRENKLKRICQK